MHYFENVFENVTVRPNKSATLPKKRSAKLSELLSGGMSRTMWLLLPAATVVAWGAVGAALPRKDVAGTYSPIVEGALSTIIMVTAFGVLGLLFLAANLLRDQHLAALALLTGAATASSSASATFVSGLSAGEIIDITPIRAVALAFGIAVVLVHVVLQRVPRRYWLLAVVLVLSIVSFPLGVDLSIFQIAVFGVAGCLMLQRGIETRRPVFASSGVFFAALGLAELVVADAMVNSLRSSTALILVLVSGLLLLGACVAEVRGAFLTQCAISREAHLTATLRSIKEREDFHERRAALAAVEGALRCLRSEARHMTWDDFVELTDAASSEVGRLQRMVIDTGSGQPTRFSIGSAIGPFLRCQQQLGTSIAVSGDPLIEVIACRDDFIRVVQNLVDNAVDHGAAKNIVIDVQRQRGQVLVFVTDDGVGVETALRDVIFDRGVSSRPADHMGLGLSLSRNVVEAAGGTLTVADAPGGGARFILGLPDPDFIDLSVDFPADRHRLARAVSR